MQHVTLRPLSVDDPWGRVDGMDRFDGFSDRAVAFYAELAVNNTREFWADHKTVYESEVRDPMRMLVAELQPDFGSCSLFRPHRDIRFSKDKSPYKTYQAAFAGISPGIGYYVHLDAQGLLAGGGFHAHSSAQVDRFREAVDDEATGSDLSEIVAGVRGNGFVIEGEQLKTKPRGYPADHPRIELLRYKSLMAAKRFGTPAWLDSPKAFDQVWNTWQQVRPLNEWITVNVGPA
jgi:uncharacterized protein (TIGR02453 family)